MSTYKILIETLAELKREIPRLNPVGYSNKEFSQESNNIQQAQANTIVKLLVKINNRLEDLDNRLGRLEDSFQTFRKNTLVTEDAIQKIYSKHPLPEVPFLSKTKHTKLVEQYDKEFRAQMRERREREQMAQREAEWWEDLGSEEANNIENDMER